MSFSPDGKRIVSGSYDHSLKVWDAQTGQMTLTLTSVSFTPDGKWIVKGDSLYITSVSFSPNGKRIVSGSLDNTLKVWDSSSLDTSK